ncbi:MAG: hypothetical protein ACREVN_05395 [Gammaproteobacteria bacterium]
MPEFNEDVKIEKSGSPKLSIRSRGSGTQHYSIRVTNSKDAAGGRNFIIRNEDSGKDVLMIDKTGNIQVLGDIRLPGADCAEDFDISGSGELGPGTVMIIGDEGKLHESRDAYDKRVAGVISGGGDYRPGIILGRRQSQDSRLPLALAGKVSCKVDARYSPIAVGDLLTTSSTPGHAMKADNPHSSYGAVIGKALRPLAGGCGSIPVLIALH